MPEQRAEDAPERRANEQRHEHGRRWEPQHAAVDARHEDATLELLIQHHDTGDDQRDREPVRCHGDHDGVLAM